MLRCGSHASSGAAGDRPLARHDPVVRAAGVGGEAERLLHARDLLREVVASPAVGLPGVDDDRVGARVLRLELRGRSAPGVADQLGAQQLHLPVGGEARAPAASRRRAGPHSDQGSGSRRRIWNSIGSARGVLDRRVDAGRVRVSLVAQRRRRARVVSRCGDAAAGRACASAGRRAACPAPANSRQPPGRRAAEELELPEAVLAVAEADREDQVDRAARADVRNAVAVAQHVDRRLEPPQPQAAAGLAAAAAGRAGTRARRPPRRAARSGGRARRANTHRSSPSAGPHRPPIVSG